MKLDRIYTRGGDEGKTSLGDGTRLPKYHVRVEAYGSIDEANAVIGLAVLHVDDREVQELLQHIQNDLFDVGADLCRPAAKPSEQRERREELRIEELRINDQQVTWLEEKIDQFNASLSPLTSFVLPGGSKASAYLHLARTVTRRAERRIVELADQFEVNAAALKYVNRLSDLFFVLARYLNDRGTHDITWKPGLHR